MAKLKTSTAMKIRFRHDTDIRRDPLALDEPPLGRVFKDTVMEVESEAVNGAPIEGNHRWYRDRNGWFYSSGQADIVETDAPIPAAEPSPLIVAPQQTPEPPAQAETEWPAENIISLLTLPRPNFSSAAPKGETRLLEKMPAPRGSLQPAGELESFRGASTGPDIAPQKLNWGVRNALIHLDWWQQRSLHGREVILALLSTGADPRHPDLKGAVLGNFSVFQGDDAGNDAHGLGTQAAIIAGGRGANVYGVAPEAQLLLGKIGRMDHEITPGQLIAGLEWAIECGADIIAMLVDFRELSDAEQQGLEEAIQKARELNIWLLAPVGNSLERRPETRFPASLDGVIAVGAHDEQGARSAFSAKSHELELLVPGEGLLTGFAEGQAVPNLRTTAISAAYLAGFLALLRQYFGDRPLTQEQIEVRLRETATPHRAITQGEDTGYGFGLLNAAALLKTLP